MWIVVVTVTERMVVSEQDKAAVRSAWVALQPRAGAA